MDDQRRRFNGAAPVRARKSRGLGLCRSSLLRLQRGRACEGAEIVPTVEIPILFHGLQRGRACEGAEMILSTAVTKLWVELQRGRACEGAEMPPHHKATGASCRLQRGRACEGAEIEGGRMAER